MSHFNETWFFFTDFRKVLRHHMSWKSVQREPGCSMQKGRWTQDEAKSLFAILRTRLKTLAVWYEQSYLNSDDVTPIRATFKCRQLPWAVYITAKLVKTFDIPQQNYWRSVVADNDAMWLRSQAASRDTGRDSWDLADDVALLGGREMTTLTFLQQKYCWQTVTLKCWKIIAHYEPIWG